MKILAIDDQYSIVEMVQSQINCEKLGLEKVDIAVSTQQARRMMLNERYQILLCDIEMPEEDGISFAKCVLSENAKIKVIFLTSHSDFNYVREAISIKGFDYLLQPATQEQLEDVIKKAMAEIQIEEKNQNLIQSSQIYIDNKEEILQASLNSYIDGDDDDDGYIKELLESNNLPIFEGGIVVGLLINFYKVDEEFEKFESGLLKYALYNVINEILAQYGLSIFLLRRKSTQYFGAIYNKHNTLCGISITEKAYQSMHDFLKKYIFSKVYLYIIRANEYMKIKDVAKDLILAEHNDLQKKNEITFISEDSVSQNTTYQFDALCFIWKKLLDQNDFKGFKNSVLLNLDSAKKENMVNYKFMVDFHRSFSEALLSYLVENDVETEKIFNESIEYLEFMNTYTDLDEFVSALDKIIINLMALDGRLGNETEMAIKYISNHISQDISVTEISDYVGMNSEYFTKIFKKNTGFALKEYIIREKISVSKVLLTTTSLSVTMVSEHVGYLSYNNFIKIFKKYENCSPTEYRKSNCN